MKLLKKVSKKLASLCLLIALAFTAVPTTKANTTVSTEVSKENVIRVQDDFYAAINKEWLESAKINPGYVENSIFTELSDKTSNDIRALFNELLANKKEYASNSTERKMITLYENILDEEARNKQGIAPIKPYLEKIKGLQTTKDLTEQMCDEEMRLFNNLFSFQIAPDIKDSTKRALSIGSTALHLGDSDEYTAPTEETKKKKELTQKFVKDLFVLAGYDEKQAETKLNNIFKLEEQLAQHMIGKKEATTDPDLFNKIYNVYTVEELDKLAPNLNLSKVMKSLGYDKANKIMLQEPKWLEALNNLFTNENLPLLKDYYEACILETAASCLDDKFDAVVDNYKKSLLGIQGDLPKEQEAFEMVNGIFSDAFGKLYIEKYFSKEAKQDVEGLVKEIIEAYKNRINKLDWMSEATKKNAIQKLDTMGVKIGYPDTWTDYSDLTLKAYEEKGSLFDNILSINKFGHKKSLEEMNKPVDKKEWITAAQTINAFYMPTNNDITFPAAILQAPFYDINRSKEANLGAIGGIIGHEITHAFDNTGARFDEKGNYKDWWLQEDYAKFGEKTKKVRDFYSKVEVMPGQTINGDLTLGENIADLGSISCLLDVMKTIPNANYKDFFESWATVWRSKGTPEYVMQLLQLDSHSPNKARTNVVLQQFEKFYEVYGIKPGDGMYIKPEDRLKVW